MKRLYEEIIHKHLMKYSEMLFLMGPRQVGKTTTSIKASKEEDPYFYFNWDIDEDRSLILEGTKAITQNCKLDVGKESKPIIVFDEIHKYSRWKNFLKGFYDKYGHDVHIIVTGSSSLDIYRKGGDSLMGRYFPFRMHPLSVGEIISPEYRATELNLKPTKIDDLSWYNLLNYGGFPKPYLTATREYHHLWENLRSKQLFREDVRDLTRIHELDLIEKLGDILRHQSGQLISYLSLSKMIRTSDVTVRRWIEILKAFYWCYEIRPWKNNITRSLIKEPKFYLWDWTLVEDQGRRFENMIASHLLKAVHFWTDSGFGNYKLHFIRDKEKREVDFVIVKNSKPWILIEAKLSNSESLSPALVHFHNTLKTDYAFQVVCNMNDINQNCFAWKDPKIVPAKTFLSQLV